MVGAQRSWGTAEETQTSVGLDCEGPGVPYPADGGGLSQTPCRAQVQKYGLSGSPEMSVWSVHALVLLKPVNCPPNVSFISWAHS